MTENSTQSNFSAEVHKIKAFQLQLYQHIDRELAKNVIEFPNNNYLSFAIYKQGEDFCLKGSFRQFDYQFKFEPTDPQQHNGPPIEYHILNGLVKDKLQGKYQQLRQMSEGLSIDRGIHGLYKQFY